MPPEVGKVGTNSPTYIEPVSERADGIKSFFQKQSPAKPKSAPAAGKVKQEEKEDRKHGVKQEAKGIKGELDIKEEKQLGDDSNAPNPEEAETEAVKEEKIKVEDARSMPEHSPSKRKRQPSVEAGDDEDDQYHTDSKKAASDGQRKGGHQTRVIRKESDDGRKEVGLFILTSYLS